MAKTNNKSDVKNVNIKKTNTTTRKKTTTKKKNTMPKKKIVIEDAVKKEIISEKDAKLVKKEKQDLDVVKDFTAKIPVKKVASTRSKSTKTSIKKDLLTSKETTAKIPVKKIKEIKDNDQKELTKEEIIKEKKERNRKKYQNQQRKYQEKNKDKKKVVIEDEIEKKQIIEPETEFVKKEITEPETDLVKKEKIAIEETKETENTKEKEEREERKEKRKKERKPINITQTLINLKDKSVDTINVVKEKTTDHRIPLGKEKKDKKVRFNRFIKEAILYSVLLTVIDVVCIITIDYFNFLRLFDVKYLNVIITVLIILIFNFFISFMVDYFVTEVWLKNRRKEKDGEPNGDNWFDEGKHSKDIEDKKESDYFRDFRLKSFEMFKELDEPSFGPKHNVNFDKIIYYKSNEDSVSNDWNKISCSIKNELGNLGVIDSEKKMDGLGVQYESEMIYHNMISELEKKNVIFTSIDEAISKYPELVKKYFGKLVKSSDNKYAALNGCVFSGGSFIYIPPHTTLDRPLQSYFRINSKRMGQFERSLIIVDDDSHLHYIEGCTAPEYTESSLHAAVVEIFVGKNSTCRYSTVQNWSNNVNNLVTKRAIVEENGTMEWIDGNIGSLVTMKYPACILKGDNSSGTCITISVASNNQEQDTGARMIHIGKNTKSKIISNSIAKNGGNATYRGKVEIKKSADNSESLVKCDSLILDELSKSDTYPVNINNNKTSNIIHEATVSKISEDNLMYLMSRGISREKATELIILGFIDKFKQELPMEYAVELNQLIKRVL